MKRMLSAINHKTKDVGFSLIEVLFAVSVLGIILTALLGAMLFSVNTVNEAKFRANAIAWASSCMDNFKKARNLGWVQFAQGGVLTVTCAGDGGSTSINDSSNGSYARKNIATNLTNGYGGTSGSGSYCLGITADTSRKVGTGGQITVTVQVGWVHFHTQGATDECDFGNTNRTATVQQVFFRYNDEQPVN